MKKVKLEYVFKVAFLSCADNGEWVERHTTLAPQNADPYDLAARILVNNIVAVERGVRVTYEGIREVGSQSTETTGYRFTMKFIRDGEKDAGSGPRVIHDKFGYKDVFGNPRTPSPGLEERV